VFEIRLLSTMGYAPWVSSCIKCGSTVFDSMYFSFLKCGFLCSKCLENDKGALKISEGAAKALNYIVHSKSIGECVGRTWQSFTTVYERKT